jgi:hypothetical protein
MAHGIDIYNDSGKIMFSSENKSYRLESKRTITRTILSGDSAVIEFTVSSVTQPIVFVKPNTSSDYSEIEYVTHSGNSWSYRVSLTSIQGYTPSHTTATVYIFTADQVAATGYGVNIYDSSGSVTFSTANRTLKISGYILSPDYSGYDEPGTATITGTIPTNYAHSAAGLGILMMYLGGPVWGIFNIGAVKASSTTVSFGPARPLIQAPDLNNYMSFTGNSYIMFIDTSLYD